MIIGIAGPTAGGKTTIANLLEERSNAFRTRYSDILIGIANERGLPHDKPTLQTLFLSLRDEEGEDVLTKKMEERIQELPYALIVIEGNRRLTDIEMLKRVAKHKKEKLLLLFIDASKEVRFERYNHRLIANGEKPITEKEFAELEANGAEDEIDDLKAIYEKEGTIINSEICTPDQIYEIVSKLI